MKTDFFDYEPNIGYSSPEPCLRKIIYEYYHKHFDDDKAKLYTDDYIKTIKQIMGWN